MKVKLFFLSVSILLASCVVGPNYVRPGVKLPAKFKEAKGKAFKLKPPPGWKVAKPCDEVDRGEWWKLFQDQTLNKLEEELNHCNQNIVNAWENYRQSLAIVDEARANFFPSLAGTFNIFRQKIGGGAATSFFSSTGGTTTTGTTTTGAFASRSATITTYSAFLTADWEPDIWGQVRRTVESNAAAAQSNQALLAATQLSA